MCGGVPCQGAGVCVCGGTPTPSVYSPLCVRKGLWHVPGWSWWDCGVSGGRGGGTVPCLGLC